ncbi:MAG: ATP-binding protein [Acidimicrobiia bacterium]|jgi:anti-sigma regulatory factor (Ser/Thr protein kinase)
MHLPPAADAARTLSDCPARARRELQALLARERWPGDVDAAVLAVHEALTNAIEHGGGVRWVRAAVEGAVLEVEVCDAGSGFAVGGWRTPPDPMSERGRGLWLISRLADGYDVATTAEGTCLRLRFLP